MSYTGLNDAEVRERISNGLVNNDDTKSTRSYKDIILGNIITPVNIVIFVIGIVLGVMGKVSTAVLYTGIIFLNIIIATIQEIKAKKRLDKIALFLSPKATVIRNGKEVVIEYDKIVLDDIVKISPGDQIHVDGTILEADYLELDESAFTGESHTVKKRKGDIVVSGTFCVTGTAYFKVTALGKDSLASKMMSGIQKTRRKNTPLQNELLNVIKIMLTVAIVLLAIVSIGNIIRNLIVSGTLLDENWLDDFVLSVAFAFEVVPIVLFLLLAITYMVSAVKMADSGVFLQRSNSVESMNYVNTLCMDKTGTITTQKLLFKDIVYYGDKDETDETISVFVNSTGSKNNTILAILDKFGKRDAKALEEIRFSSERKFSAVKAEINGVEKCVYFGSNSALGEYFSNSKINEDIKAFSSKGLRTIVVATSENVNFLADDFAMPKLEPIALIALEDELRPNCKKTIELFIDNGIDIKVISGDDPETVEALFKIIGIKGERKIISGDELDALSGTEKTKAILETNIFGRMKPHQKEEIIDTLKLNGRYVAMVGDGVNDVRSLKNANLSVSLESGSGAAKAVSDMVLVKDDFAALPTSLNEGRRTVSGMRNILKVYLSRNFIIAVLILLIMIISFGKLPFSVECNSIYGFITVSIPALMMVFWARSERNEKSVLSEVLRYAVPMAIMIGFVGFILYTVTVLCIQNGLFGFEVFEFASDEYESASALLFVYLLFAGVLQLLFVQPYFRIFSFDGKTCSDIKPTILVVVGIIVSTLLMVATRYFDIYIDVIDQYLFKEFFNIIPLNPPDMVLPIAFVGVWFVFTMMLMRTNLFDKLCDYIENKFAKSTEKYVVNNANYEDKDLMGKLRASRDEIFSVKDLIKGDKDGKNKN